MDQTMTPEQLLETLWEREAELARVKQTEKEIEATYKELRDFYFSIFDTMFGANTYVRLQSDKTGMIIARELRPKEPYPVIDWSVIEANVTPEQWKKVTDTVRVPNEDKLYTMIEKGVVAKGVLELATSYKDPVPSLNYREPNKQEAVLWEAKRKQKREAREESA